MQSNLHLAGGKRVGIQGVRASFHAVAATQFFGAMLASVEECPTFRSLASGLKEGRSDFAMMAIHNSSVGSLIPNLMLIDEYAFGICGEIALRVDLALIARAGETLASLNEVYSHPVALSQCDRFFALHPHLSAMGAADTAESAKDLATSKVPGRGCIASVEAAEVYGLNVLARGIQNGTNNCTRFFVLVNRPTTPELFGAPTKAAFSIPCADLHDDIERLTAKLNKNHFRLSQLTSLSARLFCEVQMREGSIVPDRYHTLLSGLTDARSFGEFAVAPTRESNSAGRPQG